MKTYVLSHLVIFIYYQATYSDVKRERVAILFIHISKKRFPFAGPRVIVRPPLLYDNLHYTQIFAELATLLGGSTAIIQWIDIIVYSVRP